MASRQMVTLTIGAGATDSETLQIRNVKEMSITTPAVLTGTITLQAGSDDTTAATFTTVQSPPATDLTLAAGKTTVMTAAPFVCVRLHSGSAEASARTFVCCLVVGE